jgi:nucleotide-binding universal stress UspA family protein
MRMCETEFLKRNPSKKLIVGVAIDGSALSDKALQTACNLVQQNRGDRLVILHVADNRYC